MAENPDTTQHIGKMDKIRQDILEAKYRVTDCKRPFDIYTQKPMLCPDEFRRHDG